MHFVIKWFTRKCLRSVVYYWLVSVHVCVLYFQMQIVVIFHGYKDGKTWEKEMWKFSWLIWSCWGWSVKAVWRSTGGHGETGKTPFFGTYIRRNTFHAILSNLQFLDETLDLPCNHLLLDPLFKVRPLLDMMDRNFVQSYKCSLDLSFDEGCCPYKRRILFHCYNPSKPAKWHLKRFEVSNARTGYVVAFDIYTGKKKHVVHWMLMC